MRKTNMIKKGNKVQYMLLAGAVVFVGSSVAMPGVYAATDTKNTIINASVGSSISMTTSATVALAITPTASGSATSASDTVSVSTNNTAGYTLQLANNDATTNLASGGNNIAATAGTFAAPAAMGANRWGFRVDGVGTFGAGPTSAQTNAASLSGTWAGVPASGSPVTLKTTAVTATNDTTTVWYGAFVNSSTPNGTYTDTVTYTATTN